MTRCQGVFCESEKRHKATDWDPWYIIPLLTFTFVLSFSSSAIKYKRLKEKEAAVDFFVALRKLGNLRILCRACAAQDHEVCVSPISSLGLILCRGTPLSVHPSPHKFPPSTKHHLFHLPLIIKGSHITLLSLVYILFILTFSEGFMHYNICL